MLVRTTKGPASIDFIASIGTATSQGFYGYTMARVEDGVVKSVKPGDQASFGQADDPGVYAGSHSLTSCGTFGQCNTPTSFVGTASFQETDSGGSGVSNVAFIALDGGSADNVNYTLNVSGWQVKQIPFETRHIDGTDSSAGAVGVNSAYGGAELFTDASAPGGVHGSIAQATPPCSNFPHNTAYGTGVGQLTLTGGVDAPSETCPIEGPRPIADSSAGATTWDAHGAVVGNRTLAPTRLWVVDLPTAENWYRPTS